MAEEGGVWGVGIESDVIDLHERKTRKECKGFCEEQERRVAIVFVYVEALRDYGIAIACGCEALRTSIYLQQRQFTLNRVHLHQANPISEDQI